MRTQRIVGIVIGILVLAGCQGSSSVRPLPEIRFHHLAPIRLDVGTIEVVSQYEPPFKAPHVEHILPISPERAASQWARDRLQAQGASAWRAVFIVRQAPMVEKRLPIDTGFTGYFKKQQSEQYESRIDVVLEIRDDNGRLMGEAVAAAHRGRTMPEGLTPNERDRLWHEMVEALITDMNTVLENTIRQHLARYLIMAP